MTGWGVDAVVVSEKIKNLIKEHAEESVSELFLQRVTPETLRGRFHEAIAMPPARSVQASQPRTGAEGRYLPQNHQLVDSQSLGYAQPPS